MVNTEGPSLPVVHIRIVREEESKGFPCDFCHKIFASERSLAHHINAEHDAVDVQDVYVCSVCRCCLLSQGDLLEHIAMRHQIQLAENNNKEYKICEYCGMKLPKITNLLEHLEMSHSSEFHQRGYASFNVTELSLTDILSIGVGDHRCKTLFRVVEMPLEENTMHQHSDPLEHTKDSAYSSRYLDVNCSDVERSSGKNNKSINKDIRKVEVTKDNSFEFECEIDIRKREVVSDVDIQEDKDSEFEMTIQCESGELASSTMEGEIILTVESKENLIWSKDIMSRVISSTGILGRAKTCDEQPNVIIERVQEECYDTGQPVSVIGVDEKETEEVVVQLFSKHDSNSERKLSAEAKADDVDETFIMVNSAGKNEKHPVNRNGAGEQNCSQRSKACCVCGNIFSNIEMLEQHQGSVHGVRIKCDLCDDTFAFSKSLRTHYMRKHNDASSFQCKVCGKAFKSRSNLWSHHLTHDPKSRRFECSQCPQRFHSKSKLSVHLQSHSGKKKYQCGECEKGFLYQSLLLSHMEKHFSEARKDLTENDCLYLVKVEADDAEEKT